MKTFILRYTFLCLPTALLLSLVACDDFLDTMPDNRTELTTTTHIKNLLVSAYPNNVPMLVTELSTDNVTDNGVTYAPYNDTQEQAYLWEDITEEGNDSPSNIWQHYYSGIAAANQSLEALEELPEDETSQALRAEALLCRAYNHFVLANVFCLPYDPNTADQVLGIPYMTQTETTANPYYERGTLAEVYQQIDADIEAALPLVNDAIYTQPKYHFNEKAAYAFAARFNLFYVKSDKSNYEKVITYANHVLGTNPASILRDWNALTSLTNADDIGNMYISADNKTNLMLITAISEWPVIYGNWSIGERYAHNYQVCQNETYFAGGPWKDYRLFLPAHLVFNPQTKLPVPKMVRYFEYIDKANSIGYNRLVGTVFTTDETLLCRAEAYILKAQPDYAKATADINNWIQSHCDPKVAAVSETDIENYYAQLPFAEFDRMANNMTFAIKKRINPVGFTVEAGKQENFIHCILHLRRLETMHEGLRWYDIKRYGIEVPHLIDKQPMDVLTKDDPRRAIQLPQSVIAAGLEANPR